MASKSAHLAIGAASGAISTVIIYKIFPSVPVHILVLSFLASISGGTAPDWLEIASWSPETGRRSVIKHRTYTHWGLFWICLAALSIFLIPVVIWAPILATFSIGAVSHLIIDWPNPMGVPWIRIKKRHSLKLWKSGEYELLMVILAWFLVGLTSYLLLYSEISRFFASDKDLIATIMRYIQLVLFEAKKAWLS